MAYFRTGGGGGVGVGAIVQLGTITIASTTEQSLILSESIDNYKYLLISMSPLGANDDLVYTAFGYPILCFLPVSYFKTNSPFTADWISGATSNLVIRTCKITYVSNTSITFKNDYNTSRPVYVYGIK